MMGGAAYTAGLPSPDALSLDALTPNSLPTWAGFDTTSFLARAPCVTMRAMLHAACTMIDTGILLIPGGSGAGSDPPEIGHACCRNLAPRYGVTPKTIRDVWSGRTWVEATRHLWTEDEIAARESDKSAKRKTPEDRSTDPEDADGADNHDDKDLDELSETESLMKKIKQEAPVSGDEAPVPGDTSRAEDVPEAGALASGTQVAQGEVAHACEVGGGGEEEATSGGEDKSCDAAQTSLQVPAVRKRRNSLQ
jgi:hypothetical protein